MENRFRRNASAKCINFLSILATAIVASPAYGAPAEGGTPGTKVLLLIGAFVVGLIIFVWIASKLMEPDRPADDDNPFIPLGIGDEEDRQAGDS